MQRKAIVTGGTGAIGRAIVSRLVADGIRVAIIDLPGTAATGGGSGEPATYPADLADFGQLEAAMSAAMGNLGGLDILVNSAGVLGDRAEDGFGTEPNWRRVLAINLDAVWHACRLATPALKASQAGRIVNIGSINSEYPSPGGPAYPTSKHAVYGLSKCLAFDLGAHGVTVNAVLPGAVDTPMSRASPSYAEWAERASAGSAVGRIAQPADIAASVAFLVREDAGFVTGHGLYVDGGLHLRLL